MRKRKNYNVYTNIVYTLLLVTLLSGCTKTNNVEQDTKGEKNKNAYQADYEVGIIKTTPERVGTNIIYLDSNLQEVRTLNYPYGNMGGCGFYVPKIVNGVMYEDPLGFGHEKDFGTIIGLDLQNGEVKEYPFNRVNITNYIVTEQYLYAISNLNQVTYLDRYCFQDESIETMELNGIISTEMALYKDTLFVFEEANNNMYRVDINQKTYELIYDLKQWFDPDVKGVIFPLVNHDMLYLPVNNKVIEYDIKNNTFSEITIPHNEARQLLVYNEKLYVSSTNIYEENTKSAIVVLDLKTKKIIGDMQFPHNIMQFDVKGEYLYILSVGDVLEKYKLDENYNTTLEKKAELQAETEGGYFYYISSFFVK